MNWNNYLSEKKSPTVYAHLGVLDGTVQCPFDISELPQDAKIISISTPLKKSKLEYINIDYLINNKTIQAIEINDLNEERLSVFATLPNLKYLHISNNKQDDIPDLSVLKSLEVLVLDGITKVKDIDFIMNIKSLKTLYTYGINHLYDLTPLTTLPQLKELWLDHGKMSGTGKSVKSLAPISQLKNLEYLSFILNIENRNHDVSPLFELKKIKHLRMLPRFYKKGQDILLTENIPHVKIPNL